MGAPQDMSTAARAGLRVMTGENGRFAVPAEMREVLCFTEDGTLYVTSTQVGSMQVLGFQERLRQNRIRFQLQLVSLSEIRELYLRTKGSGKATDVVSGEESNLLQIEIMRLVRSAVERRATDIHFVIEQNLCRVKFRIDGLLYVHGELGALHALDLCSTIYQSMCDVADPMYQASKSQDARMKNEYASKCGLLNARIATRPTDQGTLFVLRLLPDRRNRRPSLNKLGFLPEQERLWRRLISRTLGFNILTGGTGSGKSTTLECSLSELLKIHPGINLITIEDPPEYLIPGAVQTPLQCDKDDEKSISEAWAKAISNLMRLDPDALMIGEVRDYASAMAAFRAAMTGHGVWTTVHANDPITALERFKDLGISQSLLTDPSLITGLINQSLVRKVCPECRKSFAEMKQKLSEEIIERISKTCDISKVYFSGDGCEHCNGTGTYERSVVAEMILPTKGFMDVFKKDGKYDARIYWLEKMAGISKCQHLIRAVNTGLVDPIIGEKDAELYLDDDIAALGV